MSPLDTSLLGAHTLLVVYMQCYMYMYLHFTLQAIHEQVLTCTSSYTASVLAYILLYQEVDRVHVSLMEHNTQYQ